MKHKILNLLFILIGTNIFAGEYAVISNKPISNIDAMQIKAIYLKKISTLNGSKVIPVNLSPRDEVRSKFEKKILNMNFSRLKGYWTKQHYLGNRPPVNMKSQESVKAFVKKVDGAIGYISLDTDTKDLNIIYRWRE